jgi:hypothetical protein
MATEHTTKNRFLVETRGVQPLTFKAVLYQNGGTVVVNATGNQKLYKGVTYRINRNDNNEDLTTIGAQSNLAGTNFVSNGDYEDLFSADLKLSYDRGAPVLNVFENTLGYTPCVAYVGLGMYQIFIGDNLQETLWQKYAYNNIPIITTTKGIGAGFFGNTTIVNSVFSYEEAIIYINSIDAATGDSEDNLLNDIDNFFRTSIEIEIYI